MEELDYKAQQHSILSASSQNYFTSVSWIETDMLWWKGFLSQSLLKTTSVCGKFNIKNKIIILIQIATKS